MPTSTQTSETDTVRVCTIQATPILFDLDASIDKCLELVIKAKEGGASLAVFPEVFLSGYPKDLDFGTRLGYRTDAGRDQFEHYYTQSMEIGDATFIRLQEGLAEIGGVDTVIGVTERVGRSLYCSAFFFAGDGTFKGYHRKLVPTALERVIWGQGDGSTIPVVDTAAGKVGAVICWENYMPLLRTTMYAGGVEFYCAPTVDDRDVWQSTMRHIATEGRCFVLAACQYLHSDDCPEGYEGGLMYEDGGALIKGGSVIVAPRGDVLAGPLYGEEGMLFADCDRRELARGSLDLDVTGHYARPDVFSLTVDRSRKDTVTEQQDD